MTGERAKFLALAVFALKYHGIVLSNNISIEHFSHTSTIAGSKLTRLGVCLFSFQCTPDQNYRFDQECIR